MEVSLMHPMSPLNGFNREASSMRPGTNEEIYRKEYDDYVMSVIQEHTNRPNAAKLRNYFEMSDGEKELELKAVDVLLARLAMPSMEEIVIGHHRGHPPNHSENLEDVYNISDANVQNNITACSSVTRLNDSSTGTNGEKEHVSSPSANLFGVAPSSVVIRHDADQMLSPLLLSHGKHTAKSSISSPDFDEDASTEPIRPNSEFSNQRPGNNSGGNSSSPALYTQHEDLSVCSSVELARRTQETRYEDNDLMLLSPDGFHSPMTPRKSNRKRFATTSGKKGADLQRLRGLQDDELHALDIQHSQSAFQHATPADEFEISSILAGASQSPILHRDELDESIRSSSSDSESIDSLQDNERLEEDENYSNSDKEDEIESVNCTILPRRARARGDDTVQNNDKAPAHLRLRDGAYFQMDPIRVRQVQKAQRKKGTRGKTKRTTTSRPGMRKPMTTPIHESSRRQSITPSHYFPSPLAPFTAGLKERLTIVANAVKGMDKLGRQPGNMNDCIVDDVFGQGVVLSLSSDQIIAIVLKLLGSEGTGKIKKRPSSAESSAPTSIIRGGTLIVLRSKEEIEQWECALLERTAYSVINHSSIPSSERKRAGIATRCAGFDIVLTTFDAIKSKDLTMPLDLNGRALLQTTASENGWFSSRIEPDTGAPRPQSCLPVSVLHKLLWHRIVFVDILGRKSYTTKAETTRLKAAVALKGMSRFVFFAQTDESTGLLEEKMKDDKKQLNSLSRVLHMDEDRAAEEIVGNALIDFHEIKSTRRVDAYEADYRDLSHIADMSIHGCGDDSSSSDSEEIYSPR
eukprot:scaffold64441_cov45-Attheya_sp.AAC.1